MESNTEDDDIFRNAGVDDVHRAHGTAGVVEDPLLVHVDIIRVLSMELVYDVRHDASCVVAVRFDASLGQVMQVVRFEYEEAVDIFVEHVERRSEDTHYKTEQSQYPAEAHFGRLR